MERIVLTQLYRFGDARSCAKESPLCALSNRVLTPHAGVATAEASHNRGMMAVKNLLAVLKTGTCPYVAA